MSDDIRIIKKYPNRRLYDTSLGSYITLEDVKKLVFDRVEFKVVDARTDKDLTQSTLLQIIAEEEASSTPIFTTAILQDLIRFYHEKSQNALSQYLEQAMELFIKQKDFFQRQFDLSQNFLINPNIIEQLKNMQNMWSPLQPKDKSKTDKNKKSEGKKSRR